MRVWSLPVTTSKAVKLQELLSQKLGKEKAIEDLFGLLGCEDLFAQLDKASANDDVRPTILAFLQFFLSSPPPCYKKAWDQDAKSICERILAKQRLINSR